MDLNPYYLIILIPPFVSWLVLLVGYMYVANRPFYYTNTEILVEGVRFILVDTGCLYIYGLILILFLLSYFFIPNKGLSITLKSSDIFLYMGNLAILSFLMYKCLKLLDEHNFDLKKRKKLKIFKFLIYLFLIPYIALSYILLILNSGIVNVYFRYFMDNFYQLHSYC